MFILIVLLSYLLGCATTIALLAYLYRRYGLSAPGTILEQEQYQTFQPLPENFQSKNSTVDAVNYIFQFAFQEMKDTARIRRYILRKLKVEFNDLKKSRLGNFFLRDIVIRSFSLGRECPVLTDIQFERQERDEGNLIKEFLAQFHADYQDGFSVTLDITLALNQQCQLYVKIRRIQGHLRLELRREPFSHWLLVFQGEPLIDLEIKSYLANREAAQLSEIIGQQIRRAIRRKQIWPNYKIRYQPFFPTSKRPSPEECASVIGRNRIPGKIHIVVRSCNRLSVPYDIFPKGKDSSLFIFLTVNINEHACEDYLRINRDQWIKYELEFHPHVHKIRVKEVPYMDRMELLVEYLQPMPDDSMVLKDAFEERNVFLLQIQGEEVNTLKQVNHLLKYHSRDGNEKAMRIVVGIPVLHSVRLPRAAVQEKTEEELATTVRLRSAVNDDSIHERSSGLTKTVKHQKHPLTHMIDLIMVNTDILDQFDAKPTLTQKPEACVKFNSKFEFQVGPNEQFLNICIWCKPPLDCDVPNISKKLILLGYTTVALAEIILDAHMSFQRETSMTLNFRSANSSKSNIDGYRKDPAKQKLAELTTHKNYDDHMAHGFVTLEIRHDPEIESTLNQEAKNGQPVSIETVFVPSEESPPTSANSSDHLFEDQTFNASARCCFCENKIWMKTGRQCRHCSVIVHRKCEEKYTLIHPCTHELVPSQISPLEKKNSTEENDSASKSDQTVARRSFRGFMNKNTNRVSTADELDATKSDPSENTSPDKRSIPAPVQTSSKLVNAASSAYTKLLEFRTKRSALSATAEMRRPRASSASENVSEDDLQLIFEKCLTANDIDTKSLEELFREKAVDHIALYAKANVFGAELFRDLTVDERKQKLEGEISRFQQEIDLQDRIRDELIVEMNNNLADENAKRRVQMRIANVDEKVQALAALTILYCSGLKHCCYQMEARSDHPNQDSTQ